MTQNEWLSIVIYFPHLCSFAHISLRIPWEQESKRSVAYALVNVRDINMICQEYGDVYALIEGEARRRKINRARRRQGVLEIRTAAHDEWKGPVTWIEWVNGLDVLVRYQAQDIR